TEAYGGLAEQQSLLALLEEHQIDLVRRQMSGEDQQLADRLRGEQASGGADRVGRRAYPGRGHQIQGGLVHAATLPDRSRAGVVAESGAASCSGIRRWRTRAPRTCSRRGISLSRTRSSCLRSAALRTR